MANLQIRSYPDPQLTEKSVAVDTSKGIDQTFIRDLIDTMYTDDGVGIAAPQVGIKQRIIVVCPEARRGKEKVYLNPEIVSASGSERGIEGCLSVPGITAEVERAARVVVKAEDIEGHPIEIKASGLEARIFQHEIDHLDGILFVDRLGLSERQDILPELRALQDS